MSEYNYSPRFLKAHEELVRKLAQLAKDGKVAEARFADVDEVRAYRTLVLNLKRSLALNHPEMAFVHNSLRTSISRDPTGWWVVSVGPEYLLRTQGKKLRGGHQNLVEVGLAPPRDQTATIHTLGDYEGAKRLLAVMSDPSVTRIIIETKPPHEFPHEGWELESEDPYVLRRTK